MSENYMYHIDMKQGDVGRYVLLPGDPGRVEAIGAFFDDARVVACHREYKTITGTLNGEKVSVTSTGIGGPSTAIAVEELHRIGADTFIRVGTCGGMQMNVKTGDVIIATAAIRAEGTSREYMPIAFPAAADFDTVTALVGAARELALPCHTGIVQCKDSFYGQHEPERMPVRRMLEDNWQAWIEGGCLASEMESAALFVISSVLHARAASVHLCLGNQERRKQGIFDPPIEGAHDAAIRVAVGALKKLIAADRSQNH